ncbi:MAG: hypothetical protein QXJ06_05340 [Candidatus Aenigmatarchaeota archaeon]
MPILLIKYKGKVRILSRTGLLKSIQIAGAFYDIASRISNEIFNKLYADPLFSVSPLLENYEDEPLLIINNLFTVFPQLKNSKIEVDRKKLNEIRLKLSQVDDINTVIKDILINKEDYSVKVINRISYNFLAKKLFYYEVYEYKNPFLIISCSQNNRENIYEILSHLTYEGIGADKSVGTGILPRFEIQDLTFKKSNIRINLSSYIPTSSSTEVFSRIEKYAPYSTAANYDVFLSYSPFGIVKIDSDVDGLVLKSNYALKVYNFRSILLPIGGV